MRLLISSVVVVCVDGYGKILMVYNKNFDAWTFTAGGTEEGLSWGQAAAKEVLEESGLIVEPEDLVPFMTLSGGGFVTEYRDGSTQCFTIGFVARKFTESGAALDEEEILETRWVSMEEARSLKKSLRATDELMAYEKWLETGEFQQVVIE